MARGFDDQLIATHASGFNSAVCLNPIQVPVVGTLPMSDVLKEAKQKKLFRNNKKHGTKQNYRFTLLVIISNKLVLTSFFHLAVHRWRSGGLVALMPNPDKPSQAKL